MTASTAPPMPRILYVDDDVHLATLVHYALAREGFEVCLVHTAREFIQMLQGDHPDLIILDLTLPDSDGFALLTSIRTSSTSPILILSGRESPGDIDRAAAQGANGWLSKPVSVPTLIGRVHDLLSQPQVSRLEIVTR